jgi:hypothetical protein
MPLSAGSLAHWDAGRHSFVVEPGKLDLPVGASSTDIRLQKTIDVHN